MTRPIRRRPVDDATALAALAHLPPLLQRIYAARGIRDAEQLDHTVGRMLPPDGMRDIDLAASRLADALQNNETIVIVGDFDADGATAVSVCMLALRTMAGPAARDRIHYLVPNRFEFGYGLTPEIVAVAARQFTPALIMTVDNGTASVEGVKHANALGINVIVTDHHLPGAERPPALAIVNPNQGGCDFAGRSTAGVGIAFYVMSALRAELRKRGWFAAASPAGPNLAELLDLVAIGTVADVVPLEYNNRILVEGGLRRIRAGRTRPGILALARVAGRDHRRLVASDIGFGIGPRLNAAGRLADMSVGIECLLTEDQLHANQLAEDLDALNRERRSIEQGMQDEAEAALDRMQQLANLPAALVVHDRNWHQGVLGILAARLRERHHRPVVALAPGDDEADSYRGSARSVPGLHIRDVLDAVATRHPGLIDRFGGHAMAAGLTLRTQHLQAFSDALTAEVAHYREAMEASLIIHTDGALEGDELVPATLDLLNEAGPFGQGFPEPRFDDVFEILSQEVIKWRHLKLRLRHDSGRIVKAMWFGRKEHVRVSHVHLVYRLSDDEWLGERSVTLVVEHAAPHRRSVA